jgi:AcrR family transcriptional regulator
MPRSGLDATRVVEEAALIADSEGLEQVTLARVAVRLGVKAPSLYNHVEGLPGLQRLLTIACLEELTEAVRDAAVGRAGADALAAMGRAYRAYAAAHPGRYLATVRAPAMGASSADDPELNAVGNRAIEMFLSVLEGWGFRGDDALHRVRVIRSMFHGFVSIEAEGGFAMPLDLDESFELMLQTLIGGLRPAST